MTSPTSRSAAAAEDVALVTRIAEGDGEALATLYDRFCSLLVALSRRILGSQAEAEDVLQEVFIQVWNQASRYDRRRSSVSTWLVLIARSRSIDRLRSRQVAERTSQTAQREQKADTSPVGGSHVLHRERRARLQRELAQLPPEQCQVLELAFYGGLTQSEIAESIGIPLGTVKTRTLLAMKKLRKALQGQIEELL